MSSSADRTACSISAAADTIRFRDITLYVKTVDLEVISTGEGAKAIRVVSSSRVYLQDLLLSESGVNNVFGVHATEVSHVGLENVDDGADNCDKALYAASGSLIIWNAATGTLAGTKTEDGGIVSDGMID